MAGTARVRRVEVPGALHGSKGCDRWDYASAFALSTSSARTLTARQWAGAVFERAPTPLRQVLVAAWVLVLGLRLGPRPSPGHVLGWRVAVDGSGSVVLEAPSRLITARNVVVVEDAQVVWVTLVRYRGRVGRAVWAAATPVHHLVVPFLLRRAERGCARERPGTG
ncbi:DUF2867 domain-containing protein [Streptomyces sp. SCA3-4]|uniref:DUF2867 domain-containing protein n=1 Tax=Streptomyces sichuanensis TaxID=2871810 RepID=UPI001CE2B7D5|nr:DUF2867 domain-containing protein [Streptomyces sichuanensis]MCA6091232.1 DUF2867 domain-containing protein [Streptomyces sichuanensis]